MIIRTFQPTDADTQAAIYNAAAGRLPGFKSATAEEVRRRTSASGFDPGTRFYAEDDGTVVGYCAFDADTGRVSYPWCRPGHEKLAYQLFGAVIAAMAHRGIERAFAAYRAEWADQLEFFEDQGFAKARDVVNFTQSITDLPTMFQRPGLNVTVVKPSDLPAIAALSPGVLRLVGTDLAEYFLKNPKFAADAVFVLRHRDSTPKAVGVMIDDPAYAPVEAIDPKMPCFRFGAFGTEGLSTKRVNGLFGFLCAPGKEAELVGQDLLWYATSRMETNSFDSLAAQAPTDAPHLLRFFERYFRKQGSFPVYEREVGLVGG